MIIESWNYLTRSRGGLRLLLFIAVLVLAVNSFLENTAIWPFIAYLVLFVNIIWWAAATTRLVLWLRRGSKPRRRHTIFEPSDSTSSNPRQEP